MKPAEPSAQVTTHVEIDVVSRQELEGAVRAVEERLREALEKLKLVEGESSGHCLSITKLEEEKRDLEVKLQWLQTSLRSIVQLQQEGLTQSVDGECLKSLHHQLRNVCLTYPLLIVQVLSSPSSSQLKVPSHRPALSRMSTP